MNKSKIEWCDYTWNPVTGCLHGCPYCYARGIANRFKPQGADELSIWYGLRNGELPAIDVGVEDNLKHHRPVIELDKGITLRSVINPYPFGFTPTFHKYRLDEPKAKTKGVKIFVCSMADLFGEWVPDEWINQILDTIEQCPQHTFMFLTKNPYGYMRTAIANRLTKLKNIWIGTTITSEKDSVRHINVPIHPRRFLSVEPLLGPLHITYLDSYDWIIIGGQTGPGAVPPKKEWVENLIGEARAYSVPVFLKSNLNWTEKIQEFPKDMCGGGL